MNEGGTLDPAWSSDLVFFHLRIFVYTSLLSLEYPLSHAPSFTAQLKAKIPLYAECKGPDAKECIRYDSVYTKL